MAGLFMLMKHLYKFFIDESLPKEDVYLSYHQNLIGAAIISFAVSPLYALVYYFLGFPKASIVILIGGLVMLSSPFILKLTRSHLLASSIFLAAFTALILWLTYYLGGIFSATTYWLALPPLIASFIAGIRTGYFWCLVSLVTITVIYCLNYLQYTYPPLPITDPLLLEYLAIVGMALVILLLVYFYDVSKKIGYQTLQNIAYLDTLTRIANRIAYDEWLLQAISKAKFHHMPFSILYLDIDKFNKINSIFGTYAADALLKEFVYRIKRTIKHTEMIARVGGDQFKIIMQDVNKDELVDIANILLKSFEFPFNIKNQEIKITISMGIVTSFADKNFNYDYVDQYAEIALNKAKSLGGSNIQYYNHELAAENAMQIEVERLLPQALNNNEFTLSFQPQFDAQQIDKITGLEVLIRWTSPKLGEIPSSVFIPIAEKTGIILRIGEWVLREACIQFMKWHREGLVNDIVLAINISFYQLYNESLLKFLKNVLLETGIPPARLELELTETVVVTDPVYIMHILHKINSLGVGTSIDDFGAGYTSLSYLTLFPVSRLKIDKVFLDNTINIENTAIIIESMIELAHKINLKVVVEGIENQEQLSFLQKVKCDYIQGFFLSKPLDTKDIYALLNKHKA